MAGIGSTGSGGWTQAASSGYRTSRSPCPLTPTCTGPPPCSSACLLGCNVALLHMPFVPRAIIRPQHIHLYDSSWRQCSTGTAPVGAPLCWQRMHWAGRSGNAGMTPSHQPSGNPCRRSKLPATGAVSSAAPAATAATSLPPHACCLAAHGLWRVLHGARARVQSHGRRAGGSGGAGGGPPRTVLLSRLSPTSFSRSRR